MPERLRTLRHCIFTGGVVEGNSKCTNPLSFAALSSSPKGTPLRYTTNFAATTKSRPLGEGGCEHSEQTEGVLSAEAISNRPTQPKGRCTVRCSGLSFPHFYFAVLIKLRLSHRYLMPEMAVTAATSQHRAMEITTTMETLSTVPR